MILDELLEFADAATIATATGAALAGDVIDLGAEPQDFGHGRGMYWVIQITTAVAGTSDLQVAFRATLKSWNIPWPADKAIEGELGA